jgi:hypothetical protein
MAWSVTALSKTPATVTDNKGFIGDGAVVSYLNNKETTMKLAVMVIASAFALSSTCVFAHTVRHKANVRTHAVYRDAALSVVSRPKYGNPNGKNSGRLHQTPAPTQSFDDPEGRDSGLSLP